VGFPGDDELCVLLSVSTQYEAGGAVSGLYAVCNMVVLADGGLYWRTFVFIVMGNRAVNNLVFMGFAAATRISGGW